MMMIFIIIMLIFVIIYLPFNILIKIAEASVLQDCPCKLKRI